MEENAPQEPLYQVLELTVVDYRGKEIDPIIGQANDQFILDNDFVKSRAFKQFFWRINIHNFELRCNKIKEKKLDVEASAIEEVIKEELIRKFEAITLEARRKLLRDARILILLEWDIANAMVLDVVRRES